MLDLLLVLTLGLQPQAQVAEVVNQTDLVQRFASDDMLVLRAAAREVAAIAPTEVNRELRDAMILALKREAEKQHLRSRAIRRGLSVEEHFDPEFIYELLRAVIAFKDSGAITVLAARWAQGLVRAEPWRHSVHERSRRLCA